MPHQIDHIIQYFNAHYFPPDDIYERCLRANHKYVHTDEFFNDDDREAFIMLASYWSALLRRAYRIFVKEMGYEPSKYWNAFIQCFVLRNTLLFHEQWKGRLDDEFKRMINKTSNPKFMMRMFTGMDWSHLKEELERELEG